MERYLPVDISYDDITEERYFVTSSRTVTEADVMLFAGLTGDYNELHTSREYAEKTAFGQRIAHGMLTLSIANGLYMRMNIFEKYTVANLGIEKWAFKKSVLFGDTLHVKLTLAEKRLTSNPDRGVIKWNVSVLNQNDEEVAGGIWVKMFLTKEAYLRKIAAN